MSLVTVIGLLAAGSITCGRRRRRNHLRKDRPRTQRQERPASMPPNASGRYVNNVWSSVQRRNASRHREYISRSNRSVPWHDMFGDRSRGRRRKKRRYLQLNEGQLFCVQQWNQQQRADRQGLRAKRNSQRSGFLAGRGRQQHGLLEHALIDTAAKKGSRLFDHAPVSHLHRAVRIRRGLRVVCDHQDGLA